MTWQSYRPSGKSTWPEHCQNVVFGPQFSHPVSARFSDGQWHRHGTGEIIQGVTKYLHVAAPEDWT
jgi:hypothetical protein